MSRLKITHLSFYRQRHVVSFIILIVILLLLLGIAGLYVPGGLSLSEQQSVVNASAIQWGTVLGKYPEQMANLPYHLLQRSSTELFGVSTLSIKLPSLLLGFASILALYQVLCMWFKRNVALITSLVATACGQFLLLAQLGTPRITYIFLSISVLLCASMLTQSSRFRSMWFIITAVVAAIAMYTPLSWYFIIALTVIGLVHPHSRFIIFRVEKWALLVGVLLFAVVFTPLGLAIAKSSEVIQSFISANNLIVTPSLNHLQNILAQYIGFVDSTNSEIIAPAYGLGIMLLVFLGLYRLFSAKYTVKSYIITTWLILLLPALFLFSMSSTLTFVPIMLLVAFAFDYLFRYWYRMFPLNPYARIAGLIPLTVLIAVLSASNITRFVYGYHYSSDAAATFTRDLPLLDSTLAMNKNSVVTLHLDPSVRSFYAYYLKSRNITNVAVTNEMPQKTVVNNNIVYISDQVYPAYVSKLDRIVVSDTVSDAGRFYVYKNIVK